MTRFKQTISILLVVFFITPGILMAKTSNDPLNTELYYLDEINIEQAWDYTTGSNRVVVAVIDTGIDMDHPDIYENIWVNTDEIAGDNVDNDNNGYVDDINGWDFIRNEADPNPKFDAGYSELGIDHGTLVAGIIGARGNNNYGIAGVNWQVSLMSLIALDGYGNGSTADVVDAIDYAVANGADIINMSLVGAVTDNNLSTAIKRAYDAGVVVVAAVGNESVGDKGQDNSVDLVTSPRYPVCIDGSVGDNHILGVGSIDMLNKKSLFSNYGSECLDINAPGEYFYGLNIYQPIFADYRDKFSGYWSGTSLATPLVAGAAALIKAYRPALTNQEIYNLILDNADNIDANNPNYRGKMGKGKLNLASIFEQAKNIVNIETGVMVSSKGGFSSDIYEYNEAGELITQFNAFADYTGGVNITKITDNNTQYIVAAQANGNLIKVFDTQGNLINEWEVSGLNRLKVNNLNNRIVVWSEDYNNSLIKLYTLGGDLLNEFAVSAPVYDIFAGDIDQDNVNEINILGKGMVLIYNQLGRLDSKILLDGTAGSLAILGNNIITGAHSGLYPEIKVYSLSGELIRSFNAYNENFKGGIDISANDNNILVGPGNTGGPHLRSFNIMGNLQYEFFTLDQKDNHGINIGYIN
ncbi:MAG: S8 family serine peptidase [Candidatus Komeilibacteria bacterium]